MADIFQGPNWDPGFLSLYCWSSVEHIGKYMKENQSWQITSDIPDISAVWMPLRGTYWQSIMDNTKDKEEWYIYVAQEKSYLAL